MVLSSLVSAGEVASLPEINQLLLFAELLIEKAVSVSEAGTQQRGEKELERERESWMHFSTPTRRKPNSLCEV